MVNHDNEGPEKVPPPTSFIVKSTQLKGTASPNSVRLKCCMVVTVLQRVNGFITCRLFPADIAVAQVDITPANIIIPQHNDTTTDTPNTKDTTDDYEPHIVTIRGHHCLVAQAAGEYTIQWSLVAEYTSSLRQAVKLEIPRSTRVSVDFFVPVPQQEFQVFPATHLNVISEDGGTRCTSVLPTCTAIEIRWSKIDPIARTRSVADEIMLVEISEGKKRSAIVTDRRDAWNSLLWDELFTREVAARVTIQTAERITRMRLTSFTVTCEQYIGHELQGETLVSKAACFFVATNGTISTLEIRIDGLHGSAGQGHKGAGSMQQGPPCRVFSVTGKKVYRWEVVDEDSRSQLLRLYSVSMYSPDSGVVSKTSDEEEFEVHIHCELRMVSHSYFVRLPTFTPLRVHRTTGFLGIQCLSVLEVQEEKSNRLTRVDVPSLPYVIRSNSLYGYKFNIPQYELLLKVTQHSGADIFAAVVEKADYEVIYTRDHLMYKCKWFIKNTDTQYARIRLPSNRCSLQSAEGGTIVNDGHELLLPMEQQKAETGFTVEATFLEHRVVQETLDLSTNALKTNGDDEQTHVVIKIKLPTIDIPITVICAKVYVPQWLSVWEYKSDALLYDSEGKYQDSVDNDDGGYDVRSEDSSTNNTNWVKKSLGRTPTNVATFTGSMIQPQKRIRMNIFAADNSDFSLEKRMIPPPQKTITTTCCVLM